MMTNQKYKTRSMIESDLAAHHAALRHNDMIFWSFFAGAFCAAIALVLV